MDTIRRFLGWLRERVIRVLVGRQSIIANVVFEQLPSQTRMHYRGEPIAFGNRLILAEQPYPEFSRN